MKGLYVLMTDGQRCLLVVDSGQLQLPSHKQWPIARKAPRHNWPTALAKHITFNNEKPMIAHKQKRPFGLHANEKFCILKLSENDLSSLYEESKAIRKWFVMHAKAIVPWSFRLTNVNEVSESDLDLQSAHCMRSLNLVDLIE